MSETGSSAASFRREESAERSQHGLLILLAGLLTFAGASGFARYAFPLLLPNMREGLNATYGQMGLVVTMNSVGYVTSSFLAGMATARFGPRRLIFISMIVAAVATTVIGLSPFIEFAQAMQCLAGFAAGGAVVPVVGLVSGSFEPRKRGVATGVIVGGFPLSIFLSSLFLPAILAGMGRDSWRYGWVVLGTLVALLGILDLLLIRNPSSQKAPEVIAASNREAPAGPPQWRLVYKNRVMWLLCVINITVGFASGVFTTFFVTYLVDQRGIPQAQAAQAWALVGLFGIVSGLVWGFISDRMGRKFKMGRKFGLSICYYAFFLALFILTFIRLPGAEYASGVLAGMSIIGGIAATVPLLGEIVGTRLAGAAFGMISIFFNIGQTISPSLAGFITDATGNFTTSMTAATTLCFVSASLCLFLRLSREKAL